MQLHMKFGAMLEVSQDELKLIGLALAGKIKPGTPEEKEALKLNAKLMEYQLLQIEERAAIAESAKNHAINLLHEASDRTQDSEIRKAWEESLKVEVNGYLHPPKSK